MQAPTCQIAGSVILQGRTNHGGTTISLDDVPVATTTSDGGFTIENVSAGFHEVTASYTGYLPRQDDSLQCQTGQTAEMPETTLLGGDADANGKIDLFDLVVVAAAYRSCAGDPNFDPRADINETGCVDIFDLVFVATNYGAVGPSDWAEVPAARGNLAEQHYLPDLRDLPALTTQQANPRP